MFQIEPIAHDTGRPAIRRTALPADTQSQFMRRAKTSGIAVIVSTRGRPQIVKALIERLGEQTLPPEQVFVIASKQDDIAGLDRNRDGLTVQIGRTGSSHQRNDGLALAGSRFRYIVFFDDDFVPSRFWLERMAAMFDAHPEIAGLTGTILADGTTTAGVPLGEAEAMVVERDFNSPDSGLLHDHFPFGGNMGCNMAFRAEAIAGIRFDERLPLYAWLEDHDFRGLVERRGRVVRADALWGVHLGHKQGRVPGATLGYAQIANAVYLARKGTVPKPYLAKLASRNLLINLVRSLRPEPYVDRRGRLRGNLIALLDLVRGRNAPERVLELFKQTRPTLVERRSPASQAERARSAA